MLRLNPNPLQTEINVPLLTDYNSTLLYDIYYDVRDKFVILCNVDGVDNEELITNAALGEENWLNT